jgi:hypothetical protein
MKVKLLSAIAAIAIILGAAGAAFAGGDADPTQPTHVGPTMKRQVLPGRIGIRHIGPRHIIRR